SLSLRSLLVLSLPLLRPPVTPPFPYTTLFRSHAVEHFPGETVPDKSHSDAFSQGESALLTHCSRMLGAGRPQVATAESGHALQPDRKSTRLNSSHVKISYAVFCLKKKSKNESS